MISVDVEIKSKKWLAEKGADALVERLCAKLISLTNLQEILTKNFTLELSVSLVSDAQIKKINQQFRQKNKATDVLSFPSLDEKKIREIGLKKLLKGRDYLFLGDIVVSYETLKKDAEAQNKTFKNHLTHLLLHSILHLIGFDHESEEMATEMEGIEISILKKLRIKNPYQLKN